MCRRSEREGSGWTRDCDFPIRTEEVLDAGGALALHLPQVDGRVRVHPAQREEVVAHDDARHRIRGVLVPRVHPEGHLAKVGREEPALLDDVEVLLEAAHPSAQRTRKHTQGREGSSSARRVCEGECFCESR